jgi:hypothetical protein
MKEAHALGRHLVETGERILAHAIAVALGFALMVVGTGMGVTMVFLPIGLPVGLAGFLLFLWGLSAAPRKQTGD